MIRATESSRPPSYPRLRTVTRSSARWRRALHRDAHVTPEKFPRTSYFLLASSQWTYNGCAEEWPSWLSSVPPMCWEDFLVTSTSDDREPRDKPDGASSEPLANADLSPDLARLVERVSQNKQPWVVVPTTALTAWQQRDARGWERVSEWLATNGVTVVRI
jgi:hypothetical protein